MLFYMFCQLAFGLLYFTVIVRLLSLSLSLIISPFVDMIVSYQDVTEAISHHGILAIVIGTVHYYLPTWAYPLVSALGFLFLAACMHLFKFIGQLHGKYAKMFLVTE